MKGVTSNEQQAVASLLKTYYSLYQMRYILIFILTAHMTSAQETMGTAVLIRQDGQEEIRVHGPEILGESPAVSIHTNFRMASVSKQFTAACIILLKNQGKLSYDDRLSRFFPDFSIGADIQLKHLLTHTSGLRDYETLIPSDRTEQVSDADVLQWLSDTSTYFPPGTRYRYSNSGFCILSQVVEKVSGVPYTRFVKEFILAPLEMDNSFVYEAGMPMPARALGYVYRDGKIRESDQSITSATKGDGCLYTSLADYKKWISAVTQNRLFDLKKELGLVNHAISRELSYGLGWFNTGDELFHTGSTCGFSNVVWFTLDGRNALVSFSNLADHHRPAVALEKELTVRKPAVSLQKILGLTD